MKVYLFYICDHDMSKYYAVLPDDVIDDGGISYSLYAFTNSKRYKTMFMQTRKKDIFYLKEVKMNKAKYESFMDQHSNQLLDTHAFNGRSINDNKVHSYTYFLLSTIMEYECVSYYGFDYILEKLSTMDDTYLEKSKDFLKPSIYKIVRDNIVKQIDEITCMPIDENYSSYFSLNELEVYMDIFGNTYTDKGVYENALLQIL
jgi:hypothetical protein